MEKLLLLNFLRLLPSDLVERSPKYVALHGKRILICKVPLSVQKACSYCFWHSLGVAVCFDVDNSGKLFVSPGAGVFSKLNKNEIFAT